MKNTLRQSLFLSIGGSDLGQEESDLQLDRMRRQSNVVDMHDALESVQKVREGKALLIQQSWRRHKVEKTLKMQDKAARCIQKNYRRHAKKLRALHVKAISIIQRAWRMYKIRRNSTSEFPGLPLPAEKSEATLEKQKQQEAKSQSQSYELLPEDALLDYGPAPALEKNSSRGESTQSLDADAGSSNSAETLDGGSVPRVGVGVEVEAENEKSPLDIESEIVYKDVLENAIEHLASQTFEDMLSQWMMIQNMFRKKGLVPAIEWLFTFFNRGEAYFWLDFLQEHLFPELKIQFKWPDCYGGGFVFSSAGWINQAPLQVARKPERPKIKRGKSDITKHTSINKGFDLNITSFAKGARGAPGSHQKKWNQGSSSSNGFGGRDGLDSSPSTSELASEDSEIAPLVSPFGTPSFISSESPSRTGGFNTNATRPMTVPKPSSSKTKLHIEGRTTRPSSRASTSASRMRTPQHHSQYHLHQQQSIRDLRSSHSLRKSLMSAQASGSLSDMDYDRLSLHSAPSLPRSLERRASPRLRMIPKWRGHFDMQMQMQPTPMKYLLDDYGSAESRRSLLMAEKRKREKLFNKVNSLNELQLNITNELIDSVIKPGPW